MPAYRNNMNQRVSVAGLMVDRFNKQELLSAVTQRLAEGHKTFIVTAYSEFLYASLTTTSVMNTLNSADIIVPDGIGILWADKFLHEPFTVKSFHAKIFQGFYQILKTGFGIIFSPESVRKTFSETIVGADLFWDLAELAEKNNHSVYILGGFEDTPQIVAQKLQSKFPKLHIAGASNKRKDDASVLDDISAVKPDILFVAFGPITQEQWIADNLGKLPVKLAIGLGGTFDYVAGKVPHPPKWIRGIGLEWAYRLATQPRRIKRIWNATYGLCQALLRYKVFTSQPYRQNVVPVLFNKENKVLVCKRNPIQPGIRWFGRPDGKAPFANYWQFPQGGIDPGERREDAAARELMEETGITSASLIKFSEHKNHYDWLNARRPLWGNISHFRGQEQHIAYFSFDGNRDEIKVDNDEFVDYTWVDVKDLLDVLHPDRHGVGKIVQTDYPSPQG